MGCESCSNNSGGVPGGCRNNGLCSSGGCNKMEVFDWLSNIELPDGQTQFDIVEVRFKNSRKGFFRNVHNLPLYTGDAVAVEASPGFDVGVVTITGELVRLQMNKKGIGVDSAEIRKVYRKARTEDLEKWKEARGQEYETMHKARKIAIQLGLEMKISDVEYQGDKTKATFYYTAEGRVDFRELIKKLAEEFKVRIEMRQIGARQEASRLGGIGSCGRELCCATWLSDFRTVSTSAARYQQLSLNPQKLAGQCGKLKCCLNYELDMYVEAYKEFPDSNTKLQTKKGAAVHMKTDIFRRMMWYSVQGDLGNSFVGLKLDRIKEIIELNKRGVEVEDLMGYVEQVVIEKEPDFDNVVGQDSLTRFDYKRGRKKGKGPHRNKPHQKKEMAGQDGPRPQNKPQQNRPPQQNKSGQGKPPQPGKNPQQGKPRQGKPFHGKGNRRPPRPEGKPQNP